MEAAGDVQHAAEGIEGRMEMSDHTVDSMGRRENGDEKEHKGGGGKTYADVLADVGHAVDSTLAAAHGDQGGIQAITQSALHAVGDAIHSAFDTAAAVKA